MTASHITTHVLDALRGRPAVALAVVLSARDGGVWTPIADAVTDPDGRVPQLGPPRVPAGEYRLRFATGAYFGAQGIETFYPEVVVVFRVGDAHCHVPLLLSPFAYSTYRGS